MHAFTVAIARGGLLAAVLLTVIPGVHAAKLDGTYKGTWTNTQDPFFSGPAVIKIKSTGPGNEAEVQITGQVQFTEFGAAVSRPFKFQLHAMNASGKGKATVSNPVLGVGKGTGQLKAHGTKAATITGKGTVPGTLATVSFTLQGKKTGGRVTATGVCQGAFVENPGQVFTLFTFAFTGK
ncbi:MAG: hypothetical protein PHC88_12235 [Terrimicrobiaceae bacterium]|nr:hypothetical protein [Terrimicrobiaceae bacterium]